MQTQDTLSLLGKLRNDPSYTEDQFHIDTNGEWKEYAEIHGTLKKRLENIPKITKYTPPIFREWRPEDNHDDDTLIIGHYSGDTVTIIRPLPYDMDPKKVKDAKLFTITTKR